MPLILRHLTGPIVDSSLNAPVYIYYGSTFRWAQLVSSKTVEAQAFLWIRPFLSSRCPAQQACPISLVGSKHREHSSGAREGSLNDRITAQGHRPAPLAAGLSSLKERSRYVDTFINVQSLLQFSFPKRRALLAVNTNDSGHHRVARIPTVINYR